VLVFPTIHGGCIAGPTAVDLEDKRDWSVRPQTRDEILPRAIAMHPALEEFEPPTRTVAAGADADSPVRKGDVRPRTSHLGCSSPI